MILDWDISWKIGEFNTIIEKENPYGINDSVWKSYSDKNYPDFTGWETSQVPIDNNKKYRYSVFFKRTNDINGKFGIWLWESNGVSRWDEQKPLKGVHLPITGISSINKNEWHLLVGYLYPNDSDKEQHVSIYDMEGNIFNISNKEISSTINTNYISFNFISPYDYSGKDIYYSYMPRIDEVNENTLTIDDILQNNL